MVAKILPPTFSLTQSLREGASGVDNKVVLRREKSVGSLTLALASPLSLLRSGVGGLLEEGAELIETESSSNGVCGDE